MKISKGNLYRNSYAANFAAQYANNRRKLNYPIYINLENYKKKDFKNTIYIFKIIE